MKQHSISAAIVAGGKARRFGGRVKPLVEVDGEAIIDRQLRVLRSRFADIVIAANDPQPFAHLGLPVIPDEAAGQGPLAGVAAALGHAHADYVLAVAGDMPYLDARAVDALVERAGPDVDAVVPFVGGYVEPLFALYSRRALRVIRARIDRGELRAQSLFSDPELRVVRVGDDTLRAIDADLRFLTNVNSEADLP